MHYNPEPIIITLLYFDDCPSWKTTLKNLNQVIDADQIPARINLLKIDSPEQAKKERFLGSPSIRVNDIDLWPEERKNYTLNCRIYRTPTGLKGSPTIEMLRERLKEILSNFGKIN
jgi:hypothetical protein